MRFSYIIYDYGVLVQGVRFPDVISLCHSQGDAGRELDLDLQLTAGAVRADEVRYRACQRPPLLRQMCSQLALIVTAAAVTNPFVLANRVLT
jgi:hypothetical protein